MTVIVWDGEALAADKQATNSGVKRTVTKIRRVRDHLIGGAGDWDACLLLMDWFEDGADQEKYPAVQKDKERWAGLLVISPDGQVIKYEQEPVPMIFEDKFYTMGSGRELALGALEMGADAAKAVEVACKYEHNCGMGVDVLRLREDA